MALKKVGVELEASGASAFTSSIDDANKAVTNFGRDAEKSAGGISAFSEIATGALRQVGVIAIEAGAAAAKAIAGFVSDSVSKAGDFEAGMNEFAAVTGDALKDSGKSVKDFSKLFIKMGRELPVSTADVQEAAIELAKGGIDPATIAAGGLRTALDLAAAGGVELADSANILAKQLGVWTDAAATAEEKSAFLSQTANLLSQAANVTTSDVSEMALGLANAGGTARTAGLDYQELVQSMALISPSFSSASDAGTSFKTFLSRLIPTTKPATEAMIDLGLATEDGASKFYDSTGAFIGMENAAQLLHDATAGLSEEERLLAFQTIFGADAIRVADSVARAGAEGYAAMGAQMAAAGTVAEQAAARQVGFNNALNNAQGSLEALQLTIGNYLLPVLSTLFNDYISPGINKITEFAEAFFASSDKLGMVISTLGTIATAIGNWIVEQAPIWAEKAIAWGEALIGWVAPYISPLLDKLTEFATAAWGWIAEQAPIFLEKLGAWGVQLAAWILPQIPIVLENLGTLIGDILTWIGKQISPLEDGTSKWAPTLYEWIEKEAIPELGPAFAKFDAAMGALLTGFIDRTADRMAEGVRQWWYGVLDEFEQGIYRLRDESLSLWAETIFTWLDETAPKVLPKAKEIAQSIIQGIHDTMADLGPELERWASSIYDWLNETGASVLASAAEVGANMIRGMVNGVRAQAAALAAAAIRVVLDAIAAAKDAILSRSPSRLTADEIGRPIVTGIMLGVTQETPNLEAHLTRLGRLTPEWFVGGFNERTGMLRGTGAAIASELVGGFADKTPWMTGELERPLNFTLENMLAAITRFVDGWNLQLGRMGAPRFGGGSLDGMFGGPPIPGGSLDGSGAISPPASPGQQYAARSYASSTTNNYNYTPSYGAAPNNPSQDFFIMQALAR